MPPTIKINSEKLYNALCLTLSDRIHQVDWNSFTEKDWSNFCRMAVVEGVAPLIHWNFKNEDISGYSIPTKVRDFLANEYYNTTAQNQVMFQELEKILEALNAEGIPVIVLKGAALAATVYPEIGLRPMGDMDLLVKNNNFDLAHHHLKELGYTEARPPLSKKLNRRIGHHIELKGGPNNAVMVELHWSLIAGDADVRSAQLDWFWEHTELLSENRDALVLNPTANLLYLSAHLMLQHGGGQARLIWFADLDKIIRTHENTIDWGDLRKNTSDLEWFTPLNFTFEELRFRLQTPLPNQVIGKNELAERQITTLLVMRKSNMPLTATNRNITNIIGLNWNSRLRYIFVKLFPDPEFMRWFYKPNPSWIWPLLYPYRWIIAGISIPKTIIELINH